MRISWWGPARCRPAVVVTAVAITAVGACSRQSPGAQTVSSCAPPYRLVLGASTAVVGGCAGGLPRVALQETLEVGQAFSLQGTPSGPQPGQAPIAALPTSSDLRVVEVVADGDRRATYRATAAGHADLTVDSGVCLSGSGHCTVVSVTVRARTGTSWS